MRHTTTHSNAQQRTASHCNISQHTATHCNLSTIMKLTWENIYQANARRLLHPRTSSRSLILGWERNLRMEAAHQLLPTVQPCRAVINWRFCPRWRLSTIWIWCDTSWIMRCGLVAAEKLQCVAVCCSVLQCVAVCCSVLRCVAVCCSVLRCVAVCCSVLQIKDIAQRLV